MSTVQPPEFTVVIQLSDDAATQIHGFLEQEGIPAESGGLRVEVVPGGCSGFSYGLKVEEGPVDDDIVTEVQGIRVFVDPFSAQYLNGITIGYHSSMTATGFTFENPNASGGCGCGSSFSA